MPAIRQLWTGAYSRLLDPGLFGPEAAGTSGVWIAGSTLARDQWRRHLGMQLRGGAGPGLRVWCWDDLWRTIGELAGNGPLWLSEAAARGVLQQAISRARAEGALEGLSGLLEWPGFRRRLRAQIAAWTRAERPVEAPPPEGDPPVGAYWAIFAHHRAVLRTLGAEDDAGFAAWASRRLLEAPPHRLGKIEAWTILGLEAETRVVWRVLEHASSQAERVRVTLAYEPQEELAELYAAHAPIRRRLLEWGFVEVPGEPTPGRPAGLAGLERELFRCDAYARAPLEATGGVRVIGAPQGEGVGLVIAREVADRLAEGAEPEDVLVVFRRWDDDAEVVLAVLRAWELPVAAAVPRPLANAPAVTALRLAMRLPVDDWETASLVKLLRHGRVRPGWPEARARLALAEAASTIRASRVFRGREALRAALDRAMDAERARGADRKTEQRHQRARQASDILERLSGLLDPLDRPRRWPEQVERLRELADRLGLGSTDELDTLWGALDDHGAVLDDLGSQRPWSWADFTGEVEALAGDLEGVPTALSGGVVRLAALEDVIGARAEHIIVANLREGVFPVREAVAADLDANPGAPTDPDRDGDTAYAREMLRFLRTVASARTSLVLVYPTTDAQGQELLAAGFLDDVLRRFHPEASPRFHVSHRRFDPALVGPAGLVLAGAPADQRVRGVALACLDRDFEVLDALARSPRHRPILDGTAAALRVLHRRTGSSGFGRYDGKLGDPKVMERIAAKFGAEYPFSPSQLESYIFCPFQFFLRYVLKLEPVDERDELDEDFTERGSRVHRLLELLERSCILDGYETSRLELASLLIENEMQIEPVEGSAVEAGLHRIDRARLRRTIERYVQQYHDYDRHGGPVQPVPHRFEIVFGSEEDDSRSYPGLTLGSGEAAVRLQGKIDRLDLVPAAAPGRTAYRVIDYKTGAHPPKKDVRESIYVQLPLYALAVERLVLGADEAILHDVGYWGLSGKGFQPIRLLEWAEDQGRLEAYLIDLVNHLRQGIFAVDPRKDDCTQRCEFAAVCRIGQVRRSNKGAVDALRLELKVR
jgi:hypothetical protein